MDINDLHDSGWNFSRRHRVQSVHPPLARRAADAIALYDHAPGRRPRPETGPQTGGQQESRSCREAAFAGDLAAVGFRAAADGFEGLLVERA